jgi:hypothetical protein
MKCKEYGRKRSWLNLRNCSGFSLEGLRKTTTNLKMALFWDVAPCSLVIAVLMVAVSTSETSVNFYQTTRRNNPDDKLGFEVLTAVSTKMAVFWVVAPCSLVEVYQRFRGPCCLHHQGATTQKTAITVKGAARHTGRVRKKKECIQKFDEEISWKKTMCMIQTEIRG